MNLAFAEVCAFCREVSWLSISIAKLTSQFAGQWVASTRYTFGMLEPYDGKLSCTVLRGEWGGNAPDLPDPMN